MATPPPPLVLVTDVPNEKWKCCICVDEHLNNVFASSSKPGPWQTQDGTLVCGGCIKTIFDRALKFDIEYPARWANVELHIFDFASIWPDREFILSYEAKRVNLKLDQQKAAQEMEENVPSYLVLGEDIQRCPKCTAPYGLWKGCNHMTCPTPLCDGSFCFICGKEASGDSTHWQKEGGGCPRFGKLDDPNHQYDRPDEDYDTDDESVVDQEWTPDVSPESWTWNTTMQQTDALRRRHMHRMLGIEVSTVHQGRLYDTEAYRLVDELLQFRDEHEVSESDWESLERTYTPELRAFIVERGEFVGLNTNEYPIKHGLLACPIGGVFNLSREAGRRKAYQWAYERHRQWNPAEEDSELDFAIFDLGPGSRADREKAAELLDLLTNSGHQLTEGQLEFTMISKPRWQFLLVKITGVDTVQQDGSNPLWHVRGEFLRNDLDDDLGLNVPAAASNDQAATQRSTPDVVNVHEENTHGWGWAIANETRVDDARIHGHNSSSEQQQVELRERRLRTRTITTRRSVAES